MSSITYKNLDCRLADFEHTLNTLSYIPLLSTVSGAGTIVYGTAEAVAGFALCALKASEYFITGNREHRDQAAAHYWYGCHGVANLARGSYEVALPVAGALVAQATSTQVGVAVAAIGNLSTFFYDKVARLRMNYSYEVLSPKTLPILGSAP